MTKLLIIVLFGSALASGFAKAHEQPPLLIDSHKAPAPLDASN